MEDFCRIHTKICLFFSDKTALLAVITIHPAVKDVRLRKYLADITDEIAMNGPNSLIKTGSDLNPYDIDFFMNEATITDVKMDPKRGDQKLNPLFKNGPYL